MDTMSIKGYELRDQLGTGGFGAVYRAYQPTIGREVAIKVILPGLANQAEFIRRFENEAQLVARLEHPHVTPLYDYWRDPEGAYLVMRWLRGGSLREALANGPFSLKSAALLLDQIAGALSVAHRNNVIHRDVKPGNILLDEDGNAYLTDFGIAKDLNLPGSHTQPDAIMGSLDYISPEQARSEPITARTDIYSLGVTLYEVISGQHPFAEASTIEKLYKHINDPLPEILNIGSPETASAINRVIQKATAKNPQHRYPDALAVAADFREAIGLEHTQANVVELLTQREHEILHLIMEGLSNKEIAQRLTVTLSTVKWYINQIYTKLGVRSRVQAMVRARELNLLVKPGEAASPSPIPTEDFHPANPYKGLQAFQSADYQVFFGRERATARLIERLGESGQYVRFLAIVGPSGSGKSSLVKAGLIPALWRGVLPGSEKWFVVEMLPGARPLDSLEIALTKVAANQAKNLREHLERDPHGLMRAAELILPNDNSDLLLIIDQFEELFILVADETERRHFLDLLVTAVTTPRSRVRLVVTLRADFYDRPLHYPECAQLLHHRLETVLPLSAEELERAITGPAEQIGVTFEPGLVATIVSEVNYQPGALPLLQYALTELFERRQGRLLTQAAYRDIGGTVGALAKRADQVYAEMTPENQELARQIFLRLVTLGEGTEDTRRRVPRFELLSLSTDSETVDELIDTFAAYRLFSLDNDSGTRTPTVELAHEAILREWKQLRQWIGENRDEIKLQQQLAHLTGEWLNGDRDSSYLVSGLRLEQFEKWARETQLALTPDERAYLKASLDRREQEQTAEAARQQRETRLEKRSRTFLRGLVAVLLVATLGAFGLTGAAVNNANEAQANFTHAEAQRLAAEANKLALQQGNSEVVALLAIRSLQLEYSPQGDEAIEVASGLNYSERMFLGHSSIITDVAFSPDGKLALTGSSDGTTRLWDVQTALEVGRFRGREKPVNSVVFSKDGNRVLTCGSDKTIRLWDVNTQQEIKRFSGHEAEVWEARFLPDEQHIMSVGLDKTARIWDSLSGEEVQRFDDFENILRSVAVSPDGRYLLTGDEAGTILMFDLSSGDRIQQFVGHTTTINDVQFSPDGRYVLSAGADNLARLWNARTGEELRQFIGQTNQVNRAVFSPDGKTILTTAGDKTVVLWDTETGALLQRFIGHTNLVFGAAFSPDGQYALTGGLEGVVRLWRVDGDNYLPRFMGHQGDIYGVTYSRDGKYVLTAGLDRTVRLWDAVTGAEVRRFEGHTNQAVYGAFSPDNTTIATASWDGTVRLWDLQSGEELKRFDHASSVNGGVSFSPDGRSLLTGALDNLARLWDVKSGVQIRQFVSHTALGNGVASTAFSPDGQYIFTGAFDDTARLWNAQTGEQIHVFAVASGASSVAYSHDGNYLLAGSWNGLIRLWDARTFQELRRFIGHRETVWDVEFSPDDRYLLSGSQDQSARLWDMQTGQELRRFAGSTAFVNAVAFSPDGYFVLTAGGDSVARVWDVDYHTTTNYLCSRLLRDLSDDERAQYGITNITPTCPPS